MNVSDERNMKISGRKLLRRIDGPVLENGVRRKIQNKTKIYDLLGEPKIKSVAYSSQGSHTCQLDFCN